jgi:hypothetical protein
MHVERQLPSAWKHPLHLLIWAGPAAFLLHDAEEILTLIPWLSTHRDQLPFLLRPLSSISRPQLIIAVLVLFAGYCLASFLAVRALKAARRPVLFLLFSGALVANGITHVLQAMYFRGYTPGVVTALLISIPYGMILARALIHLQLTTIGRFFGLVLIGLALQVPLIIFAFMAAGIL